MNEMDKEEYFAELRLLYSLDPADCGKSKLTSISDLGAFWRIPNGGWPEFLEEKDKSA
jgi:hypothetical protein